MTEPTFPPNPYIVNRPIRKTENFFGRQALFDFIKFSLEDQQQIILLEGQRRIGKSSILLQIPQRITLNNFVYVLFDLHDKISQPLPIILEELAKTIISSLGLALVGPSAGEIHRDGYGTFENFLAEVNHHLDGKNLVLLLDEFDVLHDSKQNSSDETFFDYLNVIVKKNLGLFIIAVIGRNLDDLPKFLALFKSSTHKTIELLDRESAETLIRRPAQGTLLYEQKAVQTILDYSAGHSLFTQAICHTIFSQARSQNNRTITSKQVIEAIPETLENQQGALTWFWDGLPIMERIALAAVAEVQESNNNHFLQPEVVIHFLESFGIQEAGKFAPILEELKKHLFLNNQGKVVVEFIRQWLLKEHPIKRSQSLDQSLKELENVNAEASNLFAIATTLEHQGKKENAHILYEQVLGINPNHFQALFRLAEQSLEKEDFKQAVVYYARAYQFDSLQHKEGYVKSLLGYGNQLWSQKNKSQNLELAKEQFEKSLKIDPDNLVARDQLRSIENFINQQYRDSENHHRKINRLKILVGAIIAVPTLIIIGVGIGMNVAKQCPPDSKKQFNLWEPCQSKKVGINEQFRNPKNKFKMKEGMDYIARKDYEKAEVSFNEAIKLDMKDPEPRIYLNNVKAVKAGNPFVVAVIAPANFSEMSKMILMGVSDSQTQFNNKNGLNGRLLEIVIVNDDENPDVAVQVAKKIKNEEPEVLAVIGHYSSDASIKALHEYKKSDSNNPPLAMISPTSTSSKLSSSSFFFRTPQSNTQLADKLATKYTKTYQKFTIIYNLNSDYSQDMKDQFKHSLESRQKIIQIMPISPLRFQELDDLKNLSPSSALALFLHEDKDDSFVNSEFLNKITNKTSVSNIQLLGGDALYSCKFLQAGGKELEGLVLAVPWFPSAEYPYVQNTQAKFNPNTGIGWGGPVTWRTAMSYDATQAFIEALRLANSKGEVNRQSILENLSFVNLPANQTSGEPLKFINGERQSPPQLIQVTKGKNPGCSDHVKFELIN